MRLGPRKRGPTPLDDALELSGDVPARPRAARAEEKRVIRSAWPKVWRGPALPATQGRLDDCLSASNEHVPSGEDR